jgi:uncharacterized protein (UPF0264 family)
VAKLLVSVRSASEAKLAVNAGAAIVDVKEPDLGSLGRAPWPIWREVRDACPDSVRVSVALGELTEWLDRAPELPPGAWSGLSFRKLGLAGAPPDWQTLWTRLKSDPKLCAGPPWIAVAYADWQASAAPDPDVVLEVARQTPSIEGILVDTFSKSAPFRPDAAWTAWAARVHEAGLILATAGGFDLVAITKLGAIAPDIVAVRGAACFGGDRRAAIDPGRVARLACCVAALPGVTSTTAQSRI